MQVRDRIKELRRVKASELRANEKNWRTHPEKQKRAMRGVLEEIGYADALIAREDENHSLVILDGHLRAEMTPEQEVPVLILDVTEAEADVILATLDPMVGLAGHDVAKIEALFREISVDSDALNEMLSEMAEDVGAYLSDEVRDQIEDEVPEPPDEAITQPGDLWILGEHRLLCGDSSSRADVDRLLDGATIQLVNTDPPYNVKVEPRSNNAIAQGSAGMPRKNHQRFDVERHPEKVKGTTKKMRAKDRPLANDFVTDEEFDRLLDAWFGNAARVLDPGRGFYIWGGYANCANYPPFLKKHELYFSQAVIWHKQHPVLTRKDFMGDHEWCFYGWKKGAGHKFYGPNNATDVWSVKKVSQQSMVHLTEKPVELAERAIQYSSHRGENVLDLFGGSGSTLIGCEKTGRHAYLMELDPLYCDVIVERWEKYTGQKGRRVSPTLAHVEEGAKS